MALIILGIGTVTFAGKKFKTAGPKDQIRYQKLDSESDSLFVKMVSMAHQLERYRKNLKPSFFFAHKFNKTIEIVATKEFSHIQFSLKDHRGIVKGHHAKSEILAKALLIVEKGLFHSIRPQ